MALLTFTDKGIYCPQADIYIDPHRPVNKCIVTHAHSDHAVKGCSSYLVHSLSVPILKHKIGSHTDIQGTEYDKEININGIKFILYPAGHVVGSAQVKVEYKGESWVVTGDYKLTEDHISTAYVPVECNTFITESTFALPIFKWKDQFEVFKSINKWWKQNKKEGKTSILTAYTLGKAQRLSKYLDQNIGEVFCHGAIFNMNEIIRQNTDIPHIKRVDFKRKDFSGCLIIAPPSVLRSSYLRRFYPYSTAFVSGWMSIKGFQSTKNVDKGFVLSDHCDWNELNTAVRNSNAEKIYVNHGFKSTFSKYLIEKGFNAFEIN